MALQIYKLWENMKNKIQIFYYSDSFARLAEYILCHHSNGTIYSGKYAMPSSIFRSLS